MCVLYRAADHVVDEYERVIAAIDDDIAEIESQVFSTESGDHAERIYKLKREVLEFRRAVSPLAAPLSAWPRAACPARRPSCARTSGTCTTTCCGRRTPSTARTGCSPTCSRRTWRA
jgi:hypothetical protein